MCFSSLVAQTERHFLSVWNCRCSIWSSCVACKSVSLSVFFLPALGDASLMLNGHESVWLLIMNYTPLCWSQLRRSSLSQTVPQQNKWITRSDGWKGRSHTPADAVPSFHPFPSPPLCLSFLFVISRPQCFIGDGEKCSCALLTWMMCLWIHVSITMYLMHLLLSVTVRHLTSSQLWVLPSQLHHPDICNLCSVSKSLLKNTIYRLSQTAAFTYPQPSDKKQDSFNMQAVRSHQRLFDLALNFHDYWTWHERLKCHFLCPLCKARERWLYIPVN